MIVAVVVGQAAGSELDKGEQRHAEREKRRRDDQRVRERTQLWSASCRSFGLSGRRQQYAHWLLLGLLMRVMF
jgi:hypothetical protein